MAKSTNLPGNQAHLLLFLYRCMHCTSVCQYRHYIWRQTNSLALHLYLLFKYTNILFLININKIILLTYIKSSEKKHFGHKQISLNWHNWQVFSVNVLRNWKNIDEYTHLQTPNKTLILTYTYSNLTSPNLWRVLCSVCRCVISLLDLKQDGLVFSKVWIFREMCIRQKKFHSFENFTRKSFFLCEVIFQKSLFSN